MKVMILAAGRGKRMGALTDDLPKPLLMVAGKPLIERLIERLVAAGFTELVINLAWHGEKIRDYLGDGSRWGATIEWSDEGPLPLGTATGVRRALTLLGKQPFLLVNSDMAGNIDFAALVAESKRTPAAMAHLLMVDNPDHNPDGDFGVSNGRLMASGAERLTYAGCGVFHPSLIQSSTESQLGSLIGQALEQGMTISANCHPGWWLDVGTPKRLQLAAQRYGAATALDSKNT